MVYPVHCLINPSDVTNDGHPPYDLCSVWGSGNPASLDSLLHSFTRQRVDAVMLTCLIVTRHSIQSYSCFPTASSDSNGILRMYEIFNM